MKNKSAFSSLRVRISPLSATISQTPLLNLASLNLKTSLSSGPLKITIRGSRRQALPRVEIKCFFICYFCVCCIVCRAFDSCLVRFFRLLTMALCGLLPFLQRKNVFHIQHKFLIGSRRHIVCHFL